MAVGVLGCSSPASHAQAAPAPSPSSGSSLSSAARPAFTSSSPSPPTAVPEEQVEAAETAGKMPKLSSCPCPAPSSSKGANHQGDGPEQIHSGNSKNDHMEKLLLLLTTIQHSLASMETSCKDTVNHLVHLNNRLTKMDNQQTKTKIENQLTKMENCLTKMENLLARVMTDTPANKHAVNRMKGLLGSMHSIVEKLFLFSIPVFLWLLFNSSATNFWMEVIKQGSFILCFIIFIIAYCSSKFKDSESIDCVLFQIYIWLLLLVLLAFWAELFITQHFFAHTSKFILWPLGTLFSILLVSFWYWGIYKEHQKVQEELKPCLRRDNSYTTVLFSGLSIMPAYALSK